MIVKNGVAKRNHYLVFKNNRYISIVEWVSARHNACLGIEFWILNSNITKDSFKILKLEVDWYQRLLKKKQIQISTVCCA